MSRSIFYINVETPGELRDQFVEWLERQADQESPSPGLGKRIEARRAAREDVYRHAADFWREINILDGKPSEPSKEQTASTLAGS